MPVFRASEKFHSDRKQHVESERDDKGHAKLLDLSILLRIYCRKVSLGDRVVAEDLHYVLPIDDVAFDDGDWN